MSIGNWRRNKKGRLAVIVLLLVVVAIIGLLFEKTRIAMFAVGAVLLVALGLEVSNTDVDLGNVVETGSISESVIERDADGNLEVASDGGLLTRVFRDAEGNVVPEGTAGAKYTDEYNCDDFDTQEAAQRFFENAGGVENDVNRLDGNNDGVACQALPSAN